MQFSMHRESDNIFVRIQREREKQKERESKREKEREKKTHGPQTNNNKIRPRFYQNVIFKKMYLLLYFMCILSPKITMKNPNAMKLRRKTYKKKFYVR